MSKHYLEPSRIIKVDGEETHLLAWWLSPVGVVLEVSGPKNHLLHQVTVTEYDGSPFTYVEGDSDPNHYCPHCNQHIGNTKINDMQICMVCYQLGDTLEGA